MMLPISLSDWFFSYWALSGVVFRDSTLQTLNPSYQSMQQECRMTSAKFGPKSGDSCFNLNGILPNRESTPPNTNRDL